MYNCSDIGVSSYVTYGPLYRGLPILADPFKNLGCLTSILDGYINQLAYMLTRHSKVMQVRFDLHYPKDGSIHVNRENLYSFCYNLKRRLSRKKVIGGHLTDSHYLCTSERYSSNHEHYHFVLLLNGNAVQKYMPILIDYVVPAWNNALNTNQVGLVDFCNHIGMNGIVIYRNSCYRCASVNNCMVQASYLAKINTKDLKGKGNWLFSCTRIPHEFICVPTNFNILYPINMWV